jgi:hypothetical protein
MLQKKNLRRHREWMRGDYLRDRIYLGSHSSVVGSEYDGTEEGNAGGDVGEGKYSEMLKGRVNNAKGPAG